MSNEVASSIRPFRGSAGYDGSSDQLADYALAVGKLPNDVTALYTEGPAVMQWAYGLNGNGRAQAAWVPWGVLRTAADRKEYLRAFISAGGGDPDARAKPVKASLPPLERISKARRARTRAENELRAAISAARERHTLQEIASVLGVSRQRVSQIVAASKS